MEIELDVDLAGILIVAILVLWLYALVSVVFGSFLRKWYEEGKEKPVSFFVVQLCWFLFVCATTIVGAVAYLVWKRMQINRMKAQKKADVMQREADAEQALAVALSVQTAPAQVSRRTDNARTESRQILTWGLLCFSLFAFLLLFEGASNITIFVFALFSVACFMGTPSSFALYNPVCGGFFLHLVRHHLPMMEGLPAEQRQEKFSSLCAAVQGKYRFRTIHSVPPGSSWGRYFIR